MTSFEARARLGLPAEGPLARADLRRGYLQAIKRHKPETDPEGFQQVREAYELLERLGSLGLDQSPPEVPAVFTPPASEKKAADNGAEAEYEGDEDSVDAAAPELRGDHLEPYRARLRGMFGLSWRVRAEVGWQAYDAFPGDVAAREFLLELLPDEARTDIIAILLEGVRVGDGSCLWRLLRFAPASVPGQELERLEREGSPYERNLAAQARLERDEPDRAIAIGEELLTSAGPLPNGLVIDGTLRLILRLEWKGDTARAGRLRERLRQHVGGTSLPVDVADAELSALFALTAELGTATYLPAEVRQGLARGALAGQFETLAAAVRASERGLGKSTVEKSLERLEREAPTLAAVMRQHTNESVPGLRTWIITPWDALWLIFVIGGAIARSSSCSSPSRQFTPAEVTLVGISDKLDELAGFQVEAFRLCGIPRDEVLCRNLPSFLSSLHGTRSCEAQRNRLALFRTAATTDHGKDLVDRLTLALPRLCRP